MIRLKDGNDYYDPSVVDGWFTCFFPFLKNGSFRTDPIRFDEELQPEVQKIPLLLEIGDEGIYNCEITAGFVGLTQDNKTASIKPEIGWFIKVEGKKVQLDLEIVMTK